jgi:erythromycin esterase-like protein
MPVDPPHPNGDNSPAEAVAQAAQELHGAPQDYDGLVQRIGEARLVLIGEASHGTHEFYRERAVITQRLIAEKGFTAVAVEADWPDAYRVNRFVRAVGPDQTSEAALRDFQRFPAWMWRNADVLNFAGWLREHNASLPAGAPRTGFYGLDLYSQRRSIEAVLDYLDLVDPEAAARARFRYGCCEDFGEDPQSYGYAASFAITTPCEREVVSQLAEMQHLATEHTRRDRRLPADEQFFAEQNARLVKNAEAYYRAMFRSHVESWNVRDRHMAESLNALLAHLDRQAPPAKIVVWAHNTHLGDARATEMGRRGEVNLGQLARERHGQAACLVGFTTYAGTVTATSDWGQPAERKRVRPALPGSYELVFHQAGPPRFWLDLRQPGPARQALREPRLERTVGVIYRPQTERLSHYFQASLPDQFDFVVHLDETRAVEPLERSADWAKGEVPETFPSGV